MVPELTLWFMVFLRVSSMLSVFPIFSAKNFPFQMRLALGALLASFTWPLLPAVAHPPADLLGLMGLMTVEIGVGLTFGFASRMVFFALETAGAIISMEIGLSLPPTFNPMADNPVTAPASILYYLAAMLWLSLDLHHWLLAGLQKSYVCLPIGGAHLSSLLLSDIIARTGQTFAVALLIAAPMLAVSFIISLVLSVMGRVVPQLNVFAESFSLRTLAGLAVFGATMQLNAQHIINCLRQLPEDMLRVAQLLGAG